MNIFHNLLILVLTVASTANCDALRPQIDSLLAELQSTPIDAVFYWNAVTLQASVNDIDPSVVAFPDQPGPAFTSRAFAIIHGAIYDAMAVFSERFKPLFRPKKMPDTNHVHKEPAVNAAIMEAAYQTLYAMYPKQRTIFDAVRNQHLSQLKTKEKEQAGITTGILVGQLVSAFILASRQNDNSQVHNPYIPTMLPGYHQVDPTNPNQGVLSVDWGNVTTFLLNSGSQYRPSNVVGDTSAGRQRYLNSTQYVEDFNEVKFIGSRNSTVRTADQTEIGNFWAYDGGPKIGVPMRLLNQIVRVISIQQKNTLEDNARLFALINYAMADAGVAVFDCKYYYNFWRPIIGIRQATGYTQADPNWVPLGSPSDTNAPNYTPPNPSYVSGHATVGSSVFEVLRLFYKTDNIRFRFQSDEYNGRTFDSVTGQVRPAKSRYYHSFSQAETENSLSRIYLGIHWRTDQKNGEILGRQVGRFIFEKLD